MAKMINFLFMQHAVAIISVATVAKPHSIQLLRLVDLLGIVRNRKLPSQYFLVSTNLIWIITPFL